MLLLTNPSPGLIIFSHSINSTLTNYDTRPTSTDPFVPLEPTVTAAPMALTWYITCYIPLVTFPPKLPVKTNVTPTIVFFMYLKVLLTGFIWDSWDIVHQFLTIKDACWRMWPIRLFLFPLSIQHFD